MRHTASTVAEVQRLAEAGWKAHTISKILRRRGVVADTTTIFEWINPEVAERRRVVQRERMRRLTAARGGGRLIVGPRGPEFRLARIKSLKELGLSANAIAKVMTFDFPDHPLTHNQVRYMLDERKGT